MDSAGNFKKIDQFVSEYRKLTDRLQQQKITHYKPRFEGVIDEMRNLLRRKRIAERKTAPNYNLFSILNIRTYENKTHTPFLANLLNPNGSHAQGALFYRKFLETCFEKTPGVIKSFTPQDYRLLSVKEEKYFPGGFIDIFIYHHSKSNPFALIIENKVYAADQKGQLNRYYKFARHFLKLPDQQIRMIYLTRSGTAPSDYSIDPELRDRLKEERVLHYISYTIGIHSWLESCTKDVEAHQLKTILFQYMNTIKNL